MSNCSIRYFISSSSPLSSHGPSEEIPVSKWALVPASPSPSASKDALILLTLFQIPTALLTFGLTAGSFYMFTRSKGARGLTSAATTSAQQAVARSGESPRQILLKRLDRLESLSNENQQWSRQLEGRLEKNVALGVESIRSDLSQIRRLLMKDNDRLQSSLSRIERLLEQLPQSSTANQMTKISSDDSSPPSGGLTAPTQKLVSKPVTSKESIWEAARDSSPFLYGQHPSGGPAKSPAGPILTDQSPKEEDTPLKYTSAFRPTVQSSDKTPDKADIARWSSLFNKKKQEQNVKGVGFESEIKEARRKAEEEEDRVAQEEEDWKAQKRGWTEDLKPTQKSFVLVNTDEPSNTVVSSSPIEVNSDHPASSSTRTDDIHHDVLPKGIVEETRPGESKETPVTETAQPEPHVASEADPLLVHQNNDRQFRSLDRSSTSQTSWSQTPRSGSSTDSSSPDDASTAARSQLKPEKAVNTDTTPSTPSITRPCFPFGFQPHSMASAFAFHFETPRAFRYGFTHPFTRAEAAVKEKENDKAREHEGLPLGEIKTHGQGCSYWTIINGVRVKRVSSWRR
ncbi:hypothetical protein [Phaffia rhodozyma]|uniref:Uncharacterized protein n=1 Tax=Phaffia rhodozyma TaxID=264483 RepID=A0A0F7SVC5_PHARH|nr:hypothetical protein [Phaffia rhodozyma]